jgi:hypothetical protein
MIQMFHIIQINIGGISISNLWSCFGSKLISFLVIPQRKYEGFILIVLEL